jgi:hypothetical protein
VEKENEPFKDYDRGCTISLSGSTITWEDVDTRAKELGLIRSRYVAYVIKKDIDGKNRYRNRDVVMFSIILLTFLALLLNIIGVI